MSSALLSVPYGPGVAGNAVCGSPMAICPLPSLTPYYPTHVHPQSQHVSADYALQAHPGLPWDYMPYTALMAPTAFASRNGPPAPVTPNWTPSCTLSAYSAQSMPNIIAAQPFKAPSNAYLQLSSTPGTIILIPSEPVPRPSGCYSPKPVHSISCTIPSSTSCSQYTNTLTSEP